MKIKEIFTKDIDRNIRGVIKIGQGQEDNQVNEELKRQELEEYVVTDEIKRHFDSFFAAYDKSIDAPTDEMGVWISGFYGSGKSHFLKILSYLLDNKTVYGKRPLDYFRNTNKITDEKTLALMEKASGISADVIKFNIDAKADANAVSDKAAILTVFLRVFNEQLGYASDIALAEMERWLDDNGYYDSFKAAFKTLKHSQWEDARINFSFIKDTVKQALVDSGAMTRANADEYMDSMGSVPVSVDSFTKIVKNYLDKKDSKHHVVFLADEVGQFIGDDGKRMLNLQSIVEELGVACQGRAWVVVTSQQQIDEVTSNFTHQSREDFSKIQGRFNTMISMSSANANEVIQKRLLDKKPEAVRQLTTLFEDNQYNINNKISFSDQIKRQKYDDLNTFVVNYPFIPYQFSLLKDVLVAVRKHGAEGKHMSDGERSMLSTFQAATRLNEDHELGALVPFAAFFRGMYEFLSHDHQVVFARAESDPLVCKSGDKNTLEMQVLQLLFMIKYLDNFDATLENLTTLSVNGLFVDREALSQKIQRVLNVLVDQKYIQRNIDTYEFLTDKEQDINEAISSYVVEDTRIIDKIGDDLSDEISTKYNYSKQYIFAFNMYVDGQVKGTTKNDLNLRVVTPLSLTSEETYRLESSSGENIILVLPENDRYIAAYRRVLQLGDYLHSVSDARDSAEVAIRASKQVERGELAKQANEILRNDLKDGEVYCLGEKLEDSSNINTRLETAYGKVIATTYRNLVYLTAYKSEADVLELLKNSSDDQLVKDNEQAIKAVITYLNRANGQRSTSMASLCETFGTIPYGYNATDVAWLVAKAFITGKVRLFFNGDRITLDMARSDAANLTRYLTKSTATKKLTIQPVKEINSKQMKDAKEFVTDILHRKSLFNEYKSSEGIAQGIVQVTREKITELKEYKLKVQQGPGFDLLDQGIDLLKRIASDDDSERIFKLISQKIDDIFEWDQDMDANAIYDFYQNEESQRIWKTSQKYVKRYEVAAGFITAGGVQKTVEQLQVRLNKRNVKNISTELRALNEQFINEFSNLVDELYVKYQTESQRSREVLLQRLADASFPAADDDQMQGQIEETFNSRDKKAQEKSEVGDYTGLNTQLHFLSQDADNLQKTLDAKSQEIARREEAARQAELAKQTPKTPDPVAVKPTPKPQPQVHVKKVKSVRIGQVNQNSWRITNQAELDQYLDQLRQQLTQELADNDILNVDFR